MFIKGNGLLLGLSRNLHLRHWLTGFRNLFKKLRIHVRSTVGDSVSSVHAFTSFHYQPQTILFPYIKFYNPVAIDEWLDTLSGNVSFSKLDANSAFNQIMISSKDRKKTAFLSSRGWGLVHATPPPPRHLLPSHELSAA